MRLRTAFLNGVLVVFIAAQVSIAQTGSPLDFVQRRDVGQQINIQPQQLEIVRRLEPICDAQCQARVMDMLMNAPAQLQSQFLAQSPEQQAQTAAELTRAESENIETEMLSNNVLDEQQMRRFLELRTQFMGNDSFLNDRVSSLLGLSGDQVSQLRTIQDAGTGLINACQGIPGLTAGEQQQGINLIQNNLIDQSINILNGAQIEIFVNLCGEGCEFDLPGDEVSPTDPETNPDAPEGGDESSPTGSDVEPGPDSGSGTRTAPVLPQPRKADPTGSNGNQPTTQPRRSRPGTTPNRDSSGSSSRIRAAAPTTQSQGSST